MKKDVKFITEEQALRYMPNTSIENDKNRRHQEIRELCEDKQSERNKQQQIEKEKSELEEKKKIIEQADKKIADIPDEEIQKIKVELHSARDLIEISIRQQGEVQGQLDGTKRQIAFLKARQESILAQQTRTSHLRTEREKVCRLGQYVLEQNERQQNEV